MKKKCILCESGGTPLTDIEAKKTLKRLRAGNKNVQFKTKIIRISSSHEIIKLSQSGKFDDSYEYNWFWVCHRRNAWKRIKLYLTQIKNPRIFNQIIFSTILY